jgi:hypothetical protein
MEVGICWGARVERKSSWQYLLAPCALPKRGVAVEYIVLVPFSLESVVMSCWNSSALMTRVGSPSDRRLWASSNMIPWWFMKVVLRRRWLVVVLTAYLMNCSTGMPK